MSKRMLIDATHAEETRVVVLDGSRLEDFDVETSTKRQLKGNIYLAKVVRVEPSLQAAFVEYGGNRHGFLAFSEIHPDYYQIPVADRQRLLEMQAEEARLEDEEDDLELALTHAAEVEPRPVEAHAPEPWAMPGTPRLLGATSVQTPATIKRSPPEREAWADPASPPLVSAPKTAQPISIHPSRTVDGHRAADSASEFEAVAYNEAEESEIFDLNGEPIEVLPPPETIGGSDHENGEDHRERRIPPRFLRNYKIQEVIRRRQIMLVQVVKEERGTKGAALTTYLSLAGRFGVLMPNSPRGGGISRKITSAADRRRLREVISELDIPRGMGLIIRTAGANRPKPEIRRDCEYLLRLWDDIREHTMKSVAPAVIYEEASLIKRAIRDVYSRDIDEILVDGEDGWRAAHDFMRMLMPAHAKKVQLWRDGGQPLFARQQVEAQLDAMLMPIVQLRSGGYLVINQAEALVAIDVNSGRSTRERNIEETALRTNLEAADEVARQLRLRDLAGLIVIDFIDMESKRHNAMVERRLKEALKNDRARIQVGHISHFGLLEMSRQRLRPSLAETSFIACPHCGGTGHVRSTESSAIHVLRGIEDEGAKRRSVEIVVHVSTPVALYLLNHKRERLREIELRYTMRVIIDADDSQIAPQFRIDKIRTRSPDEIPPVVTVDRPLPAPQPVEAEDEEDEDADITASDEDEDETEEDAAEEARSAETAGGTDEENERRRKRRRRRRRGGRRDEQPGVAETAAEEVASPAEPDSTVDAEAEEPATPEPAPVEETAEPLEAVSSDEDPRSRRRGRRGGRRRRRDNEGDLSPFAVPGADQPDLLPAYAGPTPADPFGQVFDIFDVMDRVEQQAGSQPPRRAASAAEIVNSSAPEPNAPSAESEPEAMPERPVPEPVAAAEVDVAPSDPASDQEPEEDANRDAEIVNTAAPEPAPEPIRAEPSRTEAVGVETPAPVPANDTGTAAPDAAEPPPAEPAIKPILIGTGAEPPAERKRGWWRR